jgi:hypothetical protein
MPPTQIEGAFIVASSSMSYKISSSLEEELKCEKVLELEEESIC